MDNHNVTHRQIDRYKDRYTHSEPTQIYRKMESNWHRTGTDISLVENNRYRTGTDFNLWKTTGTGPEFPFCSKISTGIPFHRNSGHSLNIREKLYEINVS